MGSEFLDKSSFLTAGVDLYLEFLARGAESCFLKRNAQEANGGTTASGRAVRD